MVKSSSQLEKGKGRYDWEVTRFEVADTLISHGPRPPATISP